MDFIHKGLNKLIRSSLKREISDYEVEKLKAISVSFICVILSVVLSIINYGKVGVDASSFIGYLIIGFIPMTILYAFNFLITIIFSGGSNGTKFGMLSAMFRGNTVLGFFGIIFDVVLFCILIVVGIIVGIPVSIYNIYRRLEMVK